MRTITLFTATELDGGIYQSKSFHISSDFLAVSMMADEWDNFRPVSGLRILSLHQRAFVLL
jgi:hypothetical protein